MDNESNQPENPKTADWMSDALSTIREPEGSILGALIDGRYMVKQKLGAGGFGVVYLALDQKMVSRPVVIKVVLEQGSSDEYSVRKFKQEIEALARVDHPSIVGIFDAGELPDGKPYLVMQYVEGTSLRAAIRPEGMEFDRAANIIRQVGRALSAAHRKEIFHRDLKPENVMLRSTSDGDEQVKIIDFGVAKVRNSVTSLSTGKERAVGTIAYMSPEQLSVCKLTAASDVYSFGVMAYEMLTGRRPTNPESMFQLLEMQRAGVRVKPMDLRPGLPQAAQDSILKALSFEPEARQQKAREFGDELSWALMDDPDRTRPQSAYFIDSQSPVSSPVRSAANTPSQAGIDTIIGDPDFAIGTTTTAAKPKISYVVAGLMGLLLVGLIVGGLWYVMKGRSNTTTSTAASGPPAAAAPERHLSYSLTVQPIRNNQIDGPPFESTGQQIFRNGWKFVVNLLPEQTGAIYIINEGPGEGGDNALNVLFPTQPKSIGLEIPANETIHTGWNQFDQNKGTEKLWIVWSAKPIPDLDTIFLNAFKTEGVIQDPAQIQTVKDFFKENHTQRDESSRPVVTSNDENRKSFVRGKGDVMVHVVKLAHEAY